MHAHAKSQGSCLCTHQESKLMELGTALCMCQELQFPCVQAKNQSHWCSLQPHGQAKIQSTCMHVLSVNVPGLLRAPGCITLCWNTVCVLQVVWAHKHTKHHTNIKTPHIHPLPFPFFILSISAVLLVAIFQNNYHFLHCLYLYLPDQHMYGRG